MDKNQRDDFLSKIFCIYDSRAEVFSQQPFICENQIDAVRGFGKEVNQAGNLFHDHSADFTLFEIGTWNKRTGEIKVYESKVSVCTGVQLKREPQSANA